MDASYTPAGGEPVSVQVIAKRPDTIVGFGGTRIHAETTTFEVRASVRSWSGVEGDRPILDVRRQQ
jgi:hypothetical protein